MTEDKMSFGAVRTDTGLSIGWSAGHFAGDEELVNEAERLCAEHVEIDPSPFGPPTVADENDPVAVMMVMWQVCRGRPGWWGNLPDHPWDEHDDHLTVH